MLTTRSATRWRWSRARRFPSWLHCSASFLVGRAVGVLAVCNASGLGSAVADGAADEGTTLSNGASLEIDGPLTIANELLTVSFVRLVSCPLQLQPRRRRQRLDRRRQPQRQRRLWHAFLLPYSESGSLEVDGNIVGGAYTAGVATMGR